MEIAEWTSLFAKARKNSFLFFMVFMVIITDILFIHTHDLRDDQVIESLIEIAEPFLFDINLHTRPSNQRSFSFSSTCSTTQVYRRLKKNFSHSESFLKITHPTIWLT
jgi:hypothetical protein